MTVSRVTTILVIDHIFRIMYTKLDLISVRCKSHCFKAANIRILSANSTHRSQLYNVYTSQRPVITVKANEDYVAPDCMLLRTRTAYRLDRRPVRARERCRISPPRFLAECCKRQLNQGSFVLLYFRLFTFSDSY